MTVGRLLTTMGFMLCGAVAGCEREPPPRVNVTAADSLQATWRLVPYPKFPGADSIKLAFGKTPVGYLDYDRTGHMFWQVMNHVAMDSLALAIRRGVADSVLYRLSKNFNAAFGTYTVDIHARKVAHHYEGGSLPSGRSFEVATPFRLSGDSLLIGRDTLTWLRFVRVR